MKKILRGFIRKYVDNYIKNHIAQCYFEIDGNKDILNFNLKNKIPFGNSFLMIKHRTTGKRILKQITNSKAQVTIADMNEFDEIGIFEIFLRIESLGKTYLKSIEFDSQNKNKILIDNKNSRILESYKNIYSNLSFNFYETQFIAESIELKEDNNHILTTGEINFFNDCDFDRIELRISSKNFRIDFPCNYTKKSDKLIFESKIRFDIIEDYLFDVLDIEIKVKKDNILIGKSEIRGYSLSEETISDGQILGSFEDASDNSLCCIFYLNYDFKLQCTTINKKDLKKVLRNKKSFYKFSSRKSKKPTVFFESFHGKFYSGQPKYIYEKMLDLGYGETFDFIWAYDGDVEIPGNPVYVNYDSKEYKKLLKKAKYLISNIDFPVLKRKKQIYLQTTHGTPYKHLGADIDSSNSKIKRGKVLQESSTWNYLLSANDYSEKTFRRAFEYDGIILNKGYPANDIFYQDNSDKISELKDKFNIDKNKKVILYAPTFRDYDVDRNNHVNFELMLDLKKFQENLSDEYVMILRLHYLLSENLDLESDLKDFIIDLSNWDDVNELYLISDILITDYSSAFFDFAHSKKPILFFVPDYEKYNDFRGLSQEVKDDLPGKEIIDEDDIIDCIKNIDKYNLVYKEKYDSFYNKYCSLGHGTSSEEIINIVFGDEVHE